MLIKISPHFLTAYRTILWLRVWWFMEEYNCEEFLGLPRPASMAMFLQLSSGSNSSALSCAIPDGVTSFVVHGSTWTIFYSITQPTVLCCLYVGLLLHIATHIFVHSLVIQFLHACWYQLSLCSTIPNDTQIPIAQSLECPLDWYLVSCLSWLYLRQRKVWWHNGK